MLLVYIIGTIILIILSILCVHVCTNVSVNSFIEITCFVLAWVFIIILVCWFFGFGGTVIYWYNCEKSVTIINKEFDKNYTTKEYFWSSYEIQKYVIGEIENKNINLNIE